ncbi:hypothetical protein [Corynebacterium sp.]|uniref:hypothetical protein n=1 Tax=Corynebacterium sp. TaxID=1720 RepID=UPI0026DAB172|nr:hypothetical protein [Corynebacterium sp.]MDO5077599.1 hypothetical protein [Corynebacterium sp.]
MLNRFSRWGDAVMAAEPSVRLCVAQWGQVAAALALSWFAMRKRNAWRDMERWVFGAGRSDD